MSNKPCWKHTNRELQAQTPLWEKNKHKSMLPGISTEELPDDALRPFGADKHCFTECNYIFLFRKRFSFKSSYQVYADSAFIKGLLLQTQWSVDSCTYFLLLPYLWHLICNFCWVFFFPLVSCECSTSGCCLGFSSNDFWSAWVQARKM